MQRTLEALKYAASLAADGLLHEFTWQDTRGLFLVSPTARAMIITVIRREQESHPQVATARFTFDHIAEFVTIPDTAETTQKIAIHKGGPDDHITYGQMVLGLFPGNGQPFKLPTILFSDERWRNGTAYHGLPLQARMLQRLMDGRDLRE